MVDDQSEDEGDAFAYDELALEFAKGLLASGSFNENPQAAVVTAWTLVPAFYEGKALFIKMFGANPDLDTFTP